MLAHLSGDEGLREAFAAGEDIHAATAAKVFDLPIEHVDGELRRRAKAVNFGLAYGMNAWGLAQRLDIAPDEAQEIIDGYFAGFPKIKAYLAAQVERARLTATPRRCSGVAATSPSSRATTAGCASSGSARR